MIQSPRVSFHTLGCRLNLFETDGLATSFEKLGAITVNESENPDIIVINTCTVTNKADSKNRNIIRNVIKKNPGAKVWVTGCYAETDKEAIEKIPGLTGVLGNTDKSSLPYYAMEKELENKEISNRFSYLNVLPRDHTRAYLKIQDGCNRVCSYCKIPSARGKGVSRPASDVLDQVKFLQDNGVGEIILTGVNLGWYRDSENKKAFNALLKKILNILEYSRLRISSIEPSDVNEELSNLLHHPRFCNFLHVPLQSGNNNILRKMKRSYTVETFYKRLSIAKKNNPQIFIGTDIITGFPGETEIEFNDSINLVKDLGISKIHAFPYSTREGTTASLLKENITKEEKKQRVKILNHLSLEQYGVYAKTQIGKPLEAILENDGTFVTDNFLKIKLIDSPLLSKLTTGQFVQITPIKIESNEKEVIILGNIAIR